MKNSKVLRVLALSVAALSIGAVYAAKDSGKAKNAIPKASSHTTVKRGKGNVSTAKAAALGNPTRKIRTDRLLQMNFDIAYGKGKKASPQIVTKNGQPSVVTNLDARGDGYELSVTPTLLKGNSPPKGKKIDPILSLKVGIKEVVGNTFGREQHLTLMSRLGQRAEGSGKDDTGKIMKVAAKATLVPKAKRR